LAAKRTFHRFPTGKLFIEQKPPGDFHNREYCLIQQFSFLYSISKTKLNSPYHFNLTHANMEVVKTNRVFYFWVVNKAIDFSITVQAKPG
jgi:hypothetical protein